MSTRPICWPPAEPRARCRIERSTLAPPLDFPARNPLSLRLVRPAELSHWRGLRFLGASLLSFTTAGTTLGPSSFPDALGAVDDPFRLPSLWQADPPARSSRRPPRQVSALQGRHRSTSRRRFGS